VINAALTKLHDKYLLEAQKSQVVKISTDVKNQERPFYIDTVASIYSILSDADEVGDVAYNSTVASIALGSDFSYSTFKMELNDVDREVDNFVNTFIHRVETMNLRENFWMDKSRFSKISRLLVRTVASEYWRKTLKFDPLVDSSELDIVRKEKEPLSAFKKRRSDFFRQPLMRNDGLLRKTIKELLFHKQAQAHANALVHMLQIVCRKTDLTFMEPLMKTIPKLVPTAAELQRIGRIPDVKIKEFKQLFHPSEWKMIMKSSIYNAETKMREFFKKELSHNNVAEEYTQLLSEHKTVNSDVLSQAVVSVKKERLAKMSQWKAASPKDTVTLHHVRYHILEEKVFETFSPHTILVAAGSRGASELPSHVKYDKEKRSYYFQDNESIFSDAAKTAAEEYIVLLNS